MQVFTFTLRVRAIAELPILRSLPHYDSGMHRDIVMLLLSDVLEPYMMLTCDRAHDVRVLAWAEVRIVASRLAHGHAKAHTQPYRLFAALIHYIMQAGTVQPSCPSCLPALAAKIVHRLQTDKRPAYRLGTMPPAMPLLEAAALLHAHRCA
jgi:hypothetical protein